MATLLLVHGGLWEEGMDATRFWAEPGIIMGLQERGFDVLAPDRLHRALDWKTEAGHLASTLTGPVVMIAGSNGCSAAARLALDFPGTVTGMILAWPATAGDPAIDNPTRAHLATLGASPDDIDALLTGQTLRGLTDVELATLDVPVGVLPSDPPNPVHQRRTVDELLRTVPQAVELPGVPEPPGPGFPPHLHNFLGTVAACASKQVPETGN